LTLNLILQDHANILKYRDIVRFIFLTGKNGEQLCFKGTSQGSWYHSTL